jgi:hypothetical protein
MCLCRIGRARWLIRITCGAFAATTVLHDRGWTVRWRASRTQPSQSSITVSLHHDCRTAVVLLLISLLQGTRRPRPAPMRDDP